MVEIFSTDRAMSLGCFVNFKAAKGTLNGLANAQKLGENPAVLVCSYKNDEPRREYIAVYCGGKWHVPKYPERLRPVKKAGTKRRHKKRLCKEYTSPEAMFNEGFPDWMNRSYPVPACIQQGLNVRQRMNH